MFGISYGMAHSIRARHGSGAQSVESLSFLQAPRKNSSGSLSEMPCDFRTSVLNGNCKEPLGSPIAFRDSINNGSGMESIVSPHHQFSSRDVVKPSSTQTPPEYTKDVAPAELPDRSPDQSMSTTDHVSSNFLQSPSSSLQSTWNSNNYTLALLNIQEADSTSIKELPCFNSERINSKIPYNTKKRDGISKFGRRLSHQLSINTSMELIPIDVASRNQNLSGPVYFQPVSSNFSSHQTFESVQSMRPPTQEDVHQFENRCFDSTQHESALLATSLRRSSQTTISSDTLPTDSGYESASLRPCDSSIASPGSLTFGFEQIGLDDSFPYTDAQFMGLSGSSQGDNFNQGMSLRQQSMQMHNPGDEETLGLPAAHFDLPLQMQGIEAQSFTVDRANQFEPNDAIYSPTSWFDARITQDFTDMDEASLNENMLADLEPQPQPLQSLSHLKDIDPFNRGMSTAGHFSNDSCAPHTHTHNSQLDWGLNSIQTHENEQIYSPPWSAESVRGFNWNFTTSTSPGAQLPIGQAATAVSDDLVSPKTRRKSLRCDYPECTYEPKGQEQWRAGNLRRHRKEKHELTPENLLVCQEGTCRKTYARLGNLMTHREAKHDCLVVRKPRMRRNTVTGATKISGIRERVSKSTRLIKSRSVPGCVGTAGV